MSNNIFSTGIHFFFKICEIGFHIRRFELPWMAVLVANDRLPRKVEKPNRYQADNKAIEAKDHPVIES